ncbi:hypothetical protein CDIK_0616 [Cucumispora dikerogammari]|nr:hypothetical protein CDIK_0616 [Cucumispora dikerogammari]
MWHFFFITNITCFRKDHLTGDKNEIEIKQNQLRQSLQTIQMKSFKYWEWNDSFFAEPFPSFILIPLRRKHFCNESYSLVESWEEALEVHFSHDTIVQAFQNDDRTSQEYHFNREIQFSNPSTSNTQAIINYVKLSVKCKKEDRLSKLKIKENHFLYDFSHYKCLFYVIFIEYDRSYKVKNKGKSEAILKKRGVNRAQNIANSFDILDFSIKLEVSIDFMDWVEGLTEGNGIATMPPWFAYKIDFKDEKVTFDEINQVLVFDGFLKRNKFCF